MDNSGTLEEKLEKAREAFKPLERESKTILANGVKHMKQYEHDLQAARPLLAPGTSKEECLEAAQKLIEHGNQLSQQQARVRQIWDARLDIFHTRRMELYVFLTRLQKSRRRLEEEMRDAIGEILYHVENYALIRSLTNKPNDDIMVQGEIQKMMENQGDEEKHFVLLQKNPFLAHLDRPKTSPCPGTVNGKRSTPIGCRYIPAELACIIMRHCDLESSVNLRQVSSVFYQSYFHCENELREKIARRYPWFHREEDIFTWAECVLVYVKRMSGRKKKWSVTDDIGKLTAKRKLTPVRTLLAKRVKSIDDWVPQYAPFEIDKEMQEFWTAAVSVNGAGETVIKVEGFDKEIVLPPGTDFDTHATYMPHVVLLRHTMVVRHNQSKMWVFLQSDPHYKRAINTHTFHHDAFELPMVFGVVKDRPYVNDKEQRDLYNFLDLRTGQLREFAPPTLARPVASYNGLMWWLVKDVYLIPTFVDLANPGNIYYRKDKIITLEKDKYRCTFFYQCNRGVHGSSRFLISQTRRGVLFIDLAKSTVTEVLNYTKDVYLDPQEYNDRVEMMPGFVNEKLDLRFVENGDLREFMTELKTRIERGEE